MWNESRQRRGLMLILSGPSGAGKSVLGRMLLKEYKDMKLSVSATTRDPRPSERDGWDYHFLKHDQFRTMAEQGEFLEYAKVFDEFYGTPKAPVERALSRGIDLLFDIDWQGTQQLKQTCSRDLVKIFILPPSLEELERRLRARGEDSDEIIARRMAKAKDEIGHWGEYHYVIVNEDLDETMAELRAILTAERKLRKRQPWLTDFVRQIPLH